MMECHRKNAEVTVGGISTVDGGLEFGGD